MIDQIDKLIEALLNYGRKQKPGSDLFQNAKISFDTPDDAFQIKPAINFFLYDIRENLQLRTSNQYAMPSPTIREELAKQGAKRITLPRQPVQVDFSYLITVWGNNNSNMAKDEHRLLGSVLRILAYYQSFPEELLIGTPFEDLTPKPRITFLHPSLLSNVGEFWTALKGKPKPTLHFTVTMPILLPEADWEVALVTDAQIEVAQK